MLHNATLWACSRTGRAYCPTCAEAARAEGRRFDRATMVEGDRCDVCRGDPCIEAAKLNAPGTPVIRDTFTARIY